LLKPSSARPRELRQAREAFLTPASAAYVEAAKKVCPPLTDEQLNNIAGSGVLVFLSTGDMELVGIDLANIFTGAQRVGRVRLLVINGNRHWATAENLHHRRHMLCEP